MTNSDSDNTRQWVEQAYALLKKRQEEQKQELQKEEIKKEEEQKQELQKEVLKKEEEQKQELKEVLITVLIKKISLEQLKLSMNQH